MKWETKVIVTDCPRHGDTRTITKFLWYPLTINGITRWLEVVKIKQWYSGPRHTSNRYVVGLCSWLDDSWIDE